MKLKLIRIGELQAFLESEVYLNAKYCPITRHRALSQLNNPAAEANDPALLLALVEGKIAAYVGFLPGRLKGEKVYWNSCWWAATEYRHLALPLFLQFIKKAEEKVLLTDMPPHTLNIIRKLRFFEMREMEAGRSIYLGIKLSEWIPNRLSALSVFRPAFHVLDVITNTLLRAYLKIRQRNISLEIQQVDKLNAEEKAFIDKHSKEELIGRDARALEWIIHHPWVLPKSECEYNYSHYHFTATADRVHFQLYRLNLGAAIKAILLIRIIDQHLFIPYAYYEEESLLEVLNFVHQLALESACISVHSFRSDWKEAWRQKRVPFLFSKIVPRSFAFHQKLSSLIPDTVVLQDGDGDVAFC